MVSITNQDREQHIESLLTSSRRVSSCINSQGPEQALATVASQWDLWLPSKVSSKQFRESPPRQNDHVKIAAVFPADGWLMRPGSEGYEFTALPGLSGIFGQYYASSHTMYFPVTWKLSSWAWGLTFLQIAIHASDAVKYGMSYSSAESELAGREALGEFVLSEFPSAASVLVRGRLAFGVGQGADGGAALLDAELNQVFGPALSLEDQHFQRVTAAEFLHGQK